MSQNTIPAVLDPDDSYQTAPHSLIESHVQLADGSAYVHKDLVRVVEPWAVEQHVGPVACQARLGDLASWVNYVLAHASGNAHLIWSEQGFHATLDYHNGKDAEIGRCGWQASFTFRFSEQWQSWMKVCTSSPLDQRQLVEWLEDHGEDVVEPDQAELLAKLRTLRATVSAQSDSRLNEDGSWEIAYQKEGRITSKLDLPPQLKLTIPVLHGETTEDGKPILRMVPIRLRATVDNSAHVVFRLSMPTKQRILDQVYAEQVEAAKTLLGDEYVLYRGA